MFWHQEQIIITRHNKSNIWRKSWRKSERRCEVNEDGRARVPKYKENNGHAIDDVKLKFLNLHTKSTHYECERTSRRERKVKLRTCFTFEEFFFCFMTWTRNAKKTLVIAACLCKENVQRIIEYGNWTIWSRKYFFCWSTRRNIISRFFSIL